jgi:GT2 family glycosyltransferase
MPSGSEPSWRVLVALLVYNGEDFVGQCLASLAGLKPGSHSFDVLLLDDASPAPGWSDRCREMTTDLGFEYYRNPRNLGISRNMNLGMLRAMEAEYDAVILMSSDTIVPSNLIPTLMRPLIEDPSNSCTTAWSNNSGVSSIPNGNPDHLAEAPELVDWVSGQFDEEFNGLSVPIPSGVGFCMAIPTAKINDVGLMDPVFGRGHAKEIDWCLRSHAAGYQSVLAPSCFVYHAGSGIKNTKSPVGIGDRMVHTRQAIIEQRYPHYVSELMEFSASDVIDGVRERALKRIVTAAAAEHGYRLETSRLHQQPGDGEVVRFRIDSHGAGAVITASYQGFETSFTVGEGGVLRTVEAIVGRPPSEIRIFDRGPVSREIEAAVGASGTVSAVHRAPYSEGVF